MAEGALGTYRVDELKADGGEPKTRITPAVGPLQAALTAALAGMPVAVAPYAVDVESRRDKTYIVCVRWPAGHRPARQRYAVTVLESARPRPQERSR